MTDELRTVNLSAQSDQGEPSTIETLEIPENLLRLAEARGCRLGVKLTVQFGWYGRDGSQFATGTNRQVVMHELPPIDAQQ